MAELLVVTGPPGAGKSTVAKRLAHTFDRSVLVTGDEFFGFLAAGAVLPWLPNADVQNVAVVRAAAAATGRFVQGGFDTVYEGVLGPWHLQEFLTAASVASVHYAVLLPPAGTCVDRVTTRLNHGFKDLEATRRVHDEFASAELDPRHVLRDPPSEIDEVVELVRRRMADGSLLYEAPGIASGASWKRPVEPTPKPQDEAPTKWDDEETARRYAEFSRTFPMYEETSRDVVRAAGLSGDATVIDLCCGTGVTTEAALDSLGPGGRIIGVDASAAMLDQARALVQDPRAEFVQSPAEELLSVVEGPVDAVICNSAIWQTDLAKVAAAVSRLLRPGGAFTFNVSRRFLIMPFTPDELAPRQPGLHDLATAIAVLDYDFVPTFRPSGPRRPPLTIDGIDETLRQSDLASEEPEIVEYDTTAAQQRAWLSIPVFSDQTPGRTYDEKMQILDAALQRVDPARSDSSRWLIFKATKS